MNLIRCFLWTLVGVMTLQGYLNADEYGSAASFFGGMGLTMSIWSETMGSTMAFWSTSTFVPLPRAVVTAALYETARHPGLKMIPALQKTIKAHQATWERFRVRSMDQMLNHADLVGGLLSDPDGRSLWTRWQLKKEEAEMALAAAKRKVCSFQVFESAACKTASAAVQTLTAEVRQLSAVVDHWERVLSLSRTASASHLWTASALALASLKNSSYMFSEFDVGLARLHDVTEPDDERLGLLKEMAHNISWSLTEHGGNSWYQRILESLLIVELWDECLAHIRQRERRVRDLMIVAGVDDLTNTNERILNASLLTVTGAADKKKIQDWFGEMSGYAWWLPEETPSLVRRCVGQEAGDCTRIGPTEITALSAQIGERSKIVEDGVRRVFIGMWNAMPAVCLLFIVELIVLVIPKRGYATSDLPPEETVSDRKRPQVIPIEYRLGLKPRILLKND